MPDSQANETQRERILVALGRKQNFKGPTFSIDFWAIKASLTSLFPKTQLLRVRTPRTNSRRKYKS
jgi:hypothetical protein